MDREEEYTGLTAPAIDSKVCWTSLNMNAYAKDEGTIQLIENINKAAEPIEPRDEYGSYKSYWISARRGDFEEFEKTKGYNDYYDGNVKDLETEWRDYYTEDRCWYKISILHHHGYTGVMIERALYQIDKGEDRPFSRPASYPHDILKWIASSTLKTIEMIRNGTYRDTVEKEVSFYRRTGTVRRCHCWELLDNFKKSDFKNISNENVRRFLNLMTGLKECPEPQGRIQTMTAGTFYECCSIGYRASGYDCGSMSPKEQYYAFANGFDGGLKELDEDDANAFDNWYDDKNRPGGNPWEVCYGGESTHVDLYVSKDERGYYLQISGDHREGEAVSFYLALKEKGYPVYLHNARKLADMFAGRDLIGIVPHSVTPNNRDYMFPEYKRVKDFMHVDREEYDKLKPFIVWQSIRGAFLSD